VKILKLDVEVIECWRTGLLIHTVQRTLNKNITETEKQALQKKTSKILMELITTQDKYIINMWIRAVDSEDSIKFLKSIVEAIRTLCRQWYSEVQIFINDIC